MVGKDVPFPEEIFPRTGAGAAGLSRPPAPRDPVVGLSATAAAGVGSPMPPVRQQPGGLRSPSALLCPAPAARGGASILLIIILKQGRNVKESRRNPPHILPPAAPAALSPSATDSQFAARRTVPLPGSAARPRHCSLPSLPAKPPRRSSAFCPPPPLSARFGRPGSARCRLSVFCTQKGKHACSPKKFFGRGKNNRLTKQGKGGMLNTHPPGGGVVWRFLR